MNYAIILAGGKGTRYGNPDLPKQFLTLGTKPIIIHTLEQFEINKNINKIIICCPSEWINYTKDLIKKYSLNSKEIYVTEGGQDRNGSLYNGCKYITDNFGLNNSDKIITHDAVRPFITQRIIDENINSLENYQAVDTCIYAVDTIVETIDGEKINSIPQRNNMMQGQTPQSFYLNEWVKLYEETSHDIRETLTDACKIFLLNNKPVGIVKGESFNIKITTPFDMELANTIIEQRNNK